jgi:hypothetical protein
VIRVKSAGAGLGSDTPFALMHVCVAMSQALLEGEVSEQDKAGVMGANLLKLLALA